MFESFNERIKNIGIYSAIYNNLSRFRNIPQEKSISLAILSLTYIFENMLTGESLILIDDVYDYITNIDATIKKEDAVKILESIIFEKGFSGINFQYYDYENRKIVNLNYKLIDITTKYSEGSQKIFLKLTDVGKEFILKTMEVYKELRITMELLFVQEQFKRGAFDEVRNSVDNLKFAVMTKLDEVNNLISEIKRAPWRVDFSYISKVYDFTLNQFEKEKEIFDRIFYLIKDIDHKNLNEKKKQKVTYIEKSLYESREYHSKLLTDYQKIMKNIMESGKKNIINFIVNKISIETKYIDLLFRGENFNPESMFIFSSYKPNKSFCFKGLFDNPYFEKEKHVILEDVDDEENIHFIETENKKVDFLVTIFNRMNNGIAKLSDIITEIEVVKLDLIMHLHQMKLIDFNDSEGLIRKAYNKCDLNYDSFEVKSTDKILKYENIEFTDFSFIPLKDDIYE